MFFQAPSQPSEALIHCLTHSPRPLSPPWFCQYCSFNLEGPPHSSSLTINPPPSSFSQLPGQNCSLLFAPTHGFQLYYNTGSSPLDWAHLHSLVWYAEWLSNTVGWMKGWAKQVVPAAASPPPHVLSGTGMAIWPQRLEIQGGKKAQRVAQTWSRAPSKVILKQKMFYYSLARVTLSSLFHLSRDLLFSF